MMRSIFVLTLLVSASMQYNWYIIRNLQSKGLVVDGGHPAQLTVETYTGTPQQLWRFEATSQPGVYYIVNKQTGAVLNKKQRLADAIDVILSPKEAGNVDQLWLVRLDNGRIYNVGEQKNLDVANAVFEPGHPLLLVEENGNIAQQYGLELIEH